MSWRRLGVILRHLPPESATQTALRENEPDDAPQVEPEGFGPWSKAEHLLARVGDAVEHLAWMQSDGKKNPPKPLPRPGVAKPPRKVTAINARALAYLREVERLHGAKPAPDWKPPDLEEAR